MKRVMQAMAAAAVLAAAQAQADVRYRVVPLETPHNEYMYIRDFNNAGQMLVGSSGHYYLSTPDGYEMFTGGLPLEPYSLEPRFLNDRGQVAFTYTNQAGAKPYLYSNGKRIDLTPAGAVNPAGGSTYVSGLNERGQVVGLYEGKVFFFDGKESRYLDMGVRQDVSAFPNGLTDAGVIVGSLRGNISDNQGFKYENGRFTYLDQYEPFAVNESNQMIASTVNMGTVFVDSDGSFSPLRFSALDLNDKGWVAGRRYVPGPIDTHAYLLRHGQFTDVNDLLVQGSRKWVLTDVDDINDKGALIAIGHLAGTTSGDQQLLALPVPEAQSFVLMFCGMGAVGVVVRRHRRASREPA